MKLLAFAGRDLRIGLSYRFRVLLQFGMLFVSLLILYFLGRMFTGAMSPYLSQYGGNYFPFVLVGIAVSSFVGVGLTALADQVRRAQVEGTLEALLATPTSIYTILIGNSLWSFVSALFGSLVILFGGALFVGLRITLWNGLASLFVLLLTFLCFLSVGMLSASFIMIFKQGNPIGLLFGTSSYFLGGVLFPIEVLPRPLQTLAQVLPITLIWLMLRPRSLLRLPTFLRKNSLLLVVLGIFGVNGSLHYEVSALWLNDEAPFSVSYVGGYLAAFVGVLKCGAAFMIALSDWYQKK